MGLDIKGSSNVPDSRLPSTVLFWVTVTLTAALAGLYLFGSSFLTTSTYTYGVDQRVKTSVEYANNSLFSKGDTTMGEGFVTDLTNAITADFRYDLKGSSRQDLHYTYSAVANVSATHRENTGDDEVRVWQRSYPLLDRVDRQASGSQILIDESVKVPFREYNEMVAKLSPDLGVNLTGSLEVVFSVNVEGQVAGEEVNLADKMVFSAPLVKPVFTIDSTYEKSRESSFDHLDEWYVVVRPYLLWASMAGALLAAVLAVAYYYSGKQRSGFKKSSYQRELASIYRLHDGVIIRSNNRIDIKGSKVIALQTFNDLLSMAEQLQLPIIASELDQASTQFVVTHGDTLFIYTLGTPTDEKVLKSVIRSSNRATKSKQ